VAAVEQQTMPMVLLAVAAAGLAVMMHQLPEALGLLIKVTLVEIMLLALQPQGQGEVEPLV
jgi:hypothetical protein